MGLLEGFGQCEEMHRPRGRQGPVAYRIVLEAEDSTGGAEAVSQPRLDDRFQRPEGNALIGQVRGTAAERRLRRPEHAGA